jgi:hypothetical protein
MNRKELLNFKRIHFEPVVFDDLRRQAKEFIDTFWETYTPPLTAEKTICIVERREHKNFDFILKNMCYYCPKWSITIICSNENYIYVKGLLQGKPATILPLFTGYGTPEQGKEEYNTLLQTERFWKDIDAEWILTVEMDCYLLRPLPKEMFDYDYVASHWAWDTTSQGGGLSLRKKEAMLQICREGCNMYPAQDLWVNNGCKQLALKTPNYVAFENWFVESCYSFHPVGVHQFWTFWEPESSCAMKEYEYHTHLMHYDL